MWNAAQHFSRDGAKCSNSTQQLGARLCIFEMAHSWLPLSRRMTRRLQTKKPFLVGMVANHVADSLIPNGIQRHSLPARFAELPAFNSVPHLVRIIKRFVADCKKTAFLFALAGPADSIRRKFERIEMHICRTYRWKAAAHSQATSAIRAAFPLGTGVAEIAIWRLG